MHPLLDNIVWHCLSGLHARFATGSGGARRYAPGFSPIVGFRDLGDPNFEALERCSEPGESFYIGSWTGRAPPSFRVTSETTMFKMLWEGALPERDAAPDAVLLGPEHASEALALATLTNPGPFGPRTPELGEYFGYFDGARLVALAGERFHAGDLHELSGICTHPDHRGHGYAKKLTLKLVRRQLERHETPFLHVMSQNEGARALYQKLGFHDYAETVVRVAERVG